MKRIMMLLAAVCVAGIVQGAAVDWQFGKDTAYNGYTVYAFDNANASTVLSALAAYDADAQSTIDGLVLASKTVSKGNAKVQGTDVGDATALMLLAVNGAFADGVTFKYDTLDITGYTYSGTDLPPGNATLASFGNTGTVVAKGGTTPDPSGTPEPTSGLLLLVGAGILGLRRKRA